MGNVPGKLAGGDGGVGALATSGRGAVDGRVVVPRRAVCVGFALEGRARRTMGLGALTTIPGRAV